VLLPRIRQAAERSSSSALLLVVWRGRVSNGSLPVVPSLPACLGRNVFAQGFGGGQWRGKPWKQNVSQRKAIMSPVKWP
jgi:hypothetical protein